MKGTINHDLSKSADHKSILDDLWNQLKLFREIAVDSKINKSPDGPNCPNFVKCDAGEKCNGMSGVNVPCGMP